MDRATVLVVPSLYEGMPLVIVEAMQRGLAVVASAVSGIPEVVVDGDTGWLVPARIPKRWPGARGGVRRSRRRLCAAEQPEAGAWRIVTHRTRLLGSGSRWSERCLSNALASGRRIDLDRIDLEKERKLST